MTTPAIDPNLPPFQPGVFALDGEGPVLLGCRCSACGRHFFPRVSRCLDCLSDALVELRLSRRGRLECFTTVHMPALGFKPPYRVGYVALPEGLRVFAPLALDEGAAPQPGATMTLVPFSLQRGAAQALAYAFAPEAA